MLVSLYVGGIIPFGVASYLWWPWEPYTEYRLVGVIAQALFWPVPLFVWLAGWVDDDNDESDMAVTPVARSVFAPVNDQIWGEGNWIECTDCLDDIGRPSFHHKNYHRG